MKTDCRILDSMEGPARQTGSWMAVAQPTSPVMALKNILVPLDFEELSLKSLEYAVPFARKYGARITLVHVVSPADHLLDFSWPVPLEEQRLARLEERLDQIREDMIPAELVVNTMVRQSRPFDAILEVADEIGADLIVLTTHGRTGLDRALLGSTAEIVVRRAPCPVLVIREKERDFV
jgi:nucleotide-binding universal stress UspA family protein